MADDNKAQDEKKTESDASKKEEKPFDAKAVARESLRMRRALIKKDAKEIKKQFDKILKDNGREGAKIKYTVVFGWDYKHRKIRVKRK